MIQTHFSKYKALWLRLAICVCALILVYQMDSYVAHRVKSCTPVRILNRECYGGHQGIYGTQFYLLANNQTGYAYCGKLISCDLQYSCWADYKLHKTLPCIEGDGAYHMATDLLDLMQGEVWLTIANMLWLMTLIVALAAAISDIFLIFAPRVQVN